MVIVFDADDTLWDCQGHFDKVMQQLYTLLEPWVSRDEAARELFATERKNMPLLGFGTKAFTLSMMETAMRVSGGELPMQQLADLQQQCYDLCRLPATPLPGVAETLGQLEATYGRDRMALFTKGELLDQEGKLSRSGLARHFAHVEITSDKGELEFRALCRKLSVDPAEMVMVGNSLKSDIAPAIAVGGWGIYIPFAITWELEHQEQFAHPRLRQIEKFGDLPQVLEDVCENSRKVSRL